MIGRLREKQYQLTADRRNDACIKFNNHRQTARYFERESSKAKQFNAWNVQNTREPKYLEILRKAESLKTRQSKLKDLLLREEEIYKRECEDREKKNSPRVHFSLSTAENKLREKRAEDSLYRPRNCRRIQSYFCGPHQTTREYSRPVLTELNTELRGKASRMSLEKSNLRDDLCDRMMNNEITSHVHNQEHAQDGYNERMDEYKENSRSARASNLYGGEVDFERRPNNAPKTEYRPAAGLSMESEHRPRSRTLHDSHFLLGNQTCLDEEGGGGHKGPNPKFVDRYAHRSLEATNVAETAAHSMDENSSEFDEVNREIDQQLENEEREEEKGESEDQVDGHNEIDEKEEREEEEEEEAAGNFGFSSMGDNASNTQQDRQFDQMILKNDRNEQQQKQQQQQQAIDREVGAKASAGLSDHRHFETEKSLPWLRMIPGDKNLSEQMFLYLSHNELKGQIQDLEKRENQASSKHQWDEALRLRDMRNRLDLSREKNLYRRDDLLLDPEVKKLGMAGIEARAKLLKDREELCTNSSMYSEEAKVLWDQWVVEDRTSVLEDARLIREDLMNQLEENWRSLAVEDKQRISDSFRDKEITNITNERDGDNSCAVRSASR